MKISPLSSICLLCLAPTFGSARPFNLVNEKGEDLLESIAGKQGNTVTVPSPRIRIPKASASVQAPIFSSDETSERSNIVRPFDLVNKKGEDLLESIASNQASASVASPVFSSHEEFESNSKAFDPNESPLERLRSQNGEISLEETIRTAFDKIHGDDTSPSNAVRFLRHFAEPTDSLSEGEAKFLEETIQNAFDKVHSDENSSNSNSKTPLEVVDFHRSFQPTDSLTQSEASFLEETLREALDKIHMDRGKVKNVRIRLRGSSEGITP